MFDISITIDQIPMYRISNKISRCQLNGNKTACLYFHLYRNGKTLETRCQKTKTVHIYSGVHFSNFHFKQKNYKKMTKCGISRKKRLRLQFETNRKSKSSKLHPREVVKNVSSKSKQIYWKSYRKWDCNRKNRLTENMDNCNMESQCSKTSTDSHYIGPILDDRLKEKILKPWKGALSSQSVCPSVCLWTGYRSDLLT